MKGRSGLGRLFQFVDQVERLARGEFVGKDVVEHVGNGRCFGRGGWRRRGGGEQGQVVDQGFLLAAFAFGFFQLIQNDAGAVDD